MRHKRQGGFSLVEVMMVVAIIGLLASIAIPQYQSFQGRSKQGEAKINLRTWYVAETAYFGEHDIYTEKTVELGFDPAEGNRYSYRFSQTCTFQVRSGGTTTTPAGTNCISLDQNRFPTFPLSPSPSPIVGTFTGTGVDPGLPGFAGTCPDCNIGGTATTNLDTELAGVDTWFISSKGGTMQTCGSGTPEMLPGVAFLVNDDVSCD